MAAASENAESSGGGKGASSCCFCCGCLCFFCLRLIIWRGRKKKARLWLFLRVAMNLNREASSRSAACRWPWRFSEGFSVFSGRRQKAFSIFVHFLLRGERVEKGEARWHRTSPRHAHVYVSCFFYVDPTKLS